MTAAPASGRRRRWLRTTLSGAFSLASVFCVFWILGPEPVVLGPYVQNVTGASAEVCWFSEKPAPFEVELVGPAGARQQQSGASASRHRLRFDDLQPGQRYTYRFRGKAAGEWEGEGAFRTAPVDHQASFRFAVVGDSGKMPSWMRLHRFGIGRLRGLFPRPAQWDVGRWLAAKKPELFVHLGDVIYSHNQLPGYETGFFHPFRTQLRQGAVSVTLGNHDMHRWEHPEFFKLFVPPTPLDPARRYRDFSHTFTWGGVRFLVLDTFWQKWEKDAKALAWLRQTLAANKHPRMIAILHSPAYTDEDGATGSQVAREVLWPLFVEHGVELVLSGDSHNYQRFRPIQGVTQVVVGTGGKSIRPVTPVRLAHHETRFGFLLLDVTGAEVRGSFWVGPGEAADRFTIR